MPWLAEVCQYHLDWCHRTVPADAPAIFIKSSHTGHGPPTVLCALLEGSFVECDTMKVSHQHQPHFVPTTVSYTWPCDWNCPLTPARGHGRWSCWAWTISSHSSFCLAFMWPVFHIVWSTLAFFNSMIDILTLYQHAILSLNHATISGTQSDLFWGFALPNVTSCSQRMVQWYGPNMEVVWWPATVVSCDLVGAPPGIHCAFYVDYTGN